ncbi:MAG: hypothetical protein OXE05_10400 [Chloroflexi bacterium]|nr:hypothetical protein [Chloroflexota bacterium]
MTTNRGGGAPLALRLWVEAILSVPMEERDNPHPVSMEVDLRTMRKRLWPKSWRGYNTDRLRRTLEEVSTALDSWEAAWPWHDPTSGQSGARRIVLISDIGTSLDDVMRIIVDLPPGASTGPQVPSTLGEWGAKHAAAYRALLNLAFQCYEPGRTHMPVGSPNDRHWIRVHDPSRYPELDEQVIIDLAYPTTKDSNQRRAFQEAMNALKTLEQAGELRLHGKRGNWRILPPADEAHIEAYIHATEPYTHAIEASATRNRSVQQPREKLRRGATEAYIYAIEGYSKAVRSLI